MKITLVVTNPSGKNLVFLTNSLHALSLAEAISKAKTTSLDNLFVVNGTYGEYLRAVPNISEKDNLDSLSVTASDIVAFVNRTRHFQSTDAISVYRAQYIASIIEQGKPFIESVDGDKAFVSSVRDVIKSNSKIILQASKEFDIDPHLLGAILIDEIVRLSAFEEIRDKFLLQLLGRNVSVGAAQVKLETANDLIKRGLYNPNPHDKNLPFSGNLRNKDREYLYDYVVDPKHNIRFAAAFIRSIITVWSKYIDLSERPEIIGTLYHQGYGKPKKNPFAIERGEQIADEFYNYAKQWLT